MVIGLHNTFYILKSFEKRIPCDFSSPYQAEIASSLYEIGNAPKYAMIPAHNIQSPMTDVASNRFSSAFYFQEVFSPPNPLISASALSNYTLHLFTFSSSSYFSFWARSYSFYSDCNKSMTSYNAFFFSLSIASACFNWDSASSSILRLGSTTNSASNVYTTARIHNERFPAALDALNTFSLSNNGFYTKTFNLSILDYGIALILSSLNSLTLVISLSVSNFFLAYSQKSFLFSIDPGATGTVLTC